MPDEAYGDLSPKGSVDVGIRELIEEINAIEGCVTTSSCAGRISVFLEGKKSRNEEEGGDQDRERVMAPTTIAGVGGKGGGGRWLFVSHDPVNMTKSDLKCAEILGMQRRDDAEMELSTRRSVREVRIIHFKFEPMILHVLTASLQQAQTILAAALQAGFRESGALNLTSSSTEQPTPMVGIRSMGLALESNVGFEHNGHELCTVPEWQLRNLLEISNDRFVENTKRIERFRILLKDLSGAPQGHRKRQEGAQWEDPQVRRERKRAEGLRMKAASSKADKEINALRMSEELLDGIELPE